MGIITALLLFTCNLHLNQTACLDTYTKCIENMSTIKVGGLSLLTNDERLAASYFYCVETDGNIDSTSDYIALVRELHDLSNREDSILIEDNFAGFHTWQKPDFFKDIVKPAKKSNTLKK